MHSNAEGWQIDGNLPVHQSKSLPMLRNQILALNCREVGSIMPTVVADMVDMNEIKK